jgi:hypothetical protein
LKNSIHLWIAISAPHCIIFFIKKWTASRNFNLSPIESSY